MSFLLVVYLPLGLLLLFGLAILDCPLRNRGPKNRLVEVEFDFQTGFKSDLDSITLVVD